MAELDQQLADRNIDRKTFTIYLRQSKNVVDAEKDWTQHYNNWLKRGLPDKYHQVAAEFFDLGRDSMKLLQTGGTFKTVSGVQFEGEIVRYDINQALLQQAIDELDREIPDWGQKSTQIRARLLMTTYQDVKNGSSQKN
jgi:hypothetical protein